MDILIRSIQLTATGREIVRERTESVETISVGRASENTIALPDLAVEQTHLTIVQGPTGALVAKAAGTLGFTHDGVSTIEAVIEPARGGELGVGSYRLDVGQGEDGQLAITIRRAAANGSEAKDRLDGFGIASVLPSRRAVSWLAVIGIVAAFLAIPIYTHLTRDAAASANANAEGAVLMDAAWSTGSLSSVHHGLEDSCEACHAEPFVAVRDETCLTCHEGLGDHADPDRLIAGMQDFSGSDALLWDVAHAFGKPGPGACTDCHTEHEGAGRMEATSQQFCSDCHETLDSRLTDTAFGNASDFGTVHPQFQAVIRPERGAEEIRLSLDNVSGDFNGLKFPHDMHLSDTNGVARMAMRLGQSGEGGALECSSCHETTADGVSFVPVEMESSCEDCHSLVYDRVGSTFRSLSHGDIEQTQADLMARDRAPRLPVSSGRRRPGPFAEGGIYYGNFSRAGPAGLTRAAFGNEGLCGECHYPSNDGAFAVEPVTQRQRWFQHGWFDHNAHTQEDCSSCHAADTSDTSTDLLLPDLESCRNCHLGEAAVEAEVPSSCAMCHSYHPPANTNGAPRRVASLRDGVSRTTE